MATIPKYEDCSLKELYDTLNFINADKVPEVFAALENEIRSREPDSLDELRDCWSIINKRNWPEYESLLSGQIETLRRRVGISPDDIAEELKYRTFWLRVAAVFVDSLVFVVPGIIGVVVTRKLDSSVTDIGAYVDLILNYLYLAYSVLLHAKYGQTVGKMVAGVKVVRVSDEGNIGFKQAALRDIVPLVYLIISIAFWFVYGFSGGDGLGVSIVATILMLSVFLLPFWGLAEIVTMLFNAKRRAVHDFIAGTVVIRVP